MTSQFQVFISSKMQELLAERHALQTLLPNLGDDLIKIRAWVFEEDAPASHMTIREVYLNALKNSALYLGLFWNGYGEWTVDEFNRATEWGIDRHIYVKNVDTEQRDPRLTEFLDAQSGVISGITPKWFNSLEDLQDQVRKSIAVWLRDRLQRRVGDSSAVLAEFGDDLPDLPTKLIGRDDLRGQAQQSLQDSGRLLLQGFGGMGKTALAATIAAEWMDAGKGTVLWLKTGSDSAEAVMEALARPFDEEKSVSSAVGNDKVRALRAALTRSQVSLVVLDDVWDGVALGQVVKAIPRNLPLMVTARQRYAMDDILEVGKLSENGALDLLGHFVRQDLRQDVHAKELCLQLGYHAFALEVAGKTLKVDRIGAGDLLNRIANAPHAISMPEDFAEEGRSSITELLDASLYALDDKTRRVFVAFGSLFVPSASPELLAEFMGQSKEDIEAALTTLQRRGLAERANYKKLGAYYIHDLAFSYAQAIAQGQASRRSAVIETCIRFLEQYADELDFLDAEQGNILGAVQAVYIQQDLAPLVKVMRWLTGTYLAARGHTLEFLTLLDAAIGAAEKLGPEYDEQRHFLLSKRGNTYYDRSDLTNALQTYQKALDLARQLGMPDREVILLCVIGKVRADQKESDADDYLQDAYRLASTLDDDFLRCFVLEYRGYYAQSQGDYEATRGYFAEEVELATRTEDTEALFFALLNLGMAEKDLGQLDAALAHHQRSLELGKAENNHIWVARAWQALGEDYLRMEQREQAETCFAQALLLFRESGIKTNIIEIESLLQSDGQAKKQDTKD